MSDERVCTGCSSLIAKLFYRYFSIMSAELRSLFVPFILAMFFFIFTEGVITIVLF